MLGLNYRTVEPGKTGPGRGAVSQYAWGTDYHSIIRDKLKALAAFLLAARPGTAVRGVVDTAPLLERDFANAAGLGWFGKNTMLINDTFGSRFFLAALLTDLEFEPDSPAGASQCGDCDACLRTCPTGALSAPFTLDARKCLNYWTIEAKGPIPPEFARSWAIGSSGAMPAKTSVLTINAFPNPPNPNSSPARDLIRLI